jgi:Tol biopolymer transport system component
MKMKYLNLSIIILIFFFRTVNGQTTHQTVFPSLGQDPPGLTPKLFAPGIISTNLNEQNVAFDPEGRELFFMLVLPSNQYVTFMSIEENSCWTDPVISNMYTQFNGGEFSISPDGQKLLFTSTKTEDGQDKSDSDIWCSVKKGDTWGTPTPIGSPINSNNMEGYPTMSSDGTLYFLSNRADTRGGFDLYCSRYINGKFSEPENLGDNVNSASNEFNPCIASNGDYLIFNSPDRPGGIGGHDLWITFKQSDGTWSMAINMGSEINSPANDATPSISADGKYLFFSSRRLSGDVQTITTFTIQKIRDLMNGPQNGSTDIYWVDTKIISELKKK